MTPNALTPCPSPEYGRGEKGNPRLAALRAAKAALLPRAAALAGEGRSYQEIAAALGVARSTVCNWLRDRPLGRAAARSLGTPRMTARLAARYEAMYHRALREWNRSRTDRRTESVVTILPAGGSPTTKTTVRTEPRIGGAACLGKALAATQALEGLHHGERSRRERLEELARDAAAGSEATRTIKTTITPSGRKVQTIVTTRSEAGLLAALRDGQGALDEKRCALETRLAAAEDAAGDVAADEATRAAISAEADVAEEELHQGLPLPGCDFDSVSRSAALPNEVIPKGGDGANTAERASLAGEPASEIHRAVPAACGFAMAHSLASASGFDNASGSDAASLANASGYDSASSVNGRPVKKRRDWRKSFVPKDLRLQMDDLSSVSRSATLPNEVMQKRGRGKAGRKRSEVGGQRSEGRDQKPRVGSADSLARALDRALGGQGNLPGVVGDPCR